MTIILFEDETYRNFATLAETRALYEFRCGGFTLRERMAAALAYPATSRVWPKGGKLLGLCRQHLMRCYGSRDGFGALLSESAPLTLVNGRVLSLAWLPELLAAPLNTVYTAGDVLIGAHLSPALASAIFYYLREQRASEALAELRRFARLHDLDDQGLAPPLISFPWDLIAENGKQLERDEPLLAARLPSYTSADSQIVVRGAPHVYVAAGARLDGPMVLDARDGPVFIDEGAHIEPFSFIQGPAYIGPNTIIASARIRGETSFGSTCRIGGEVEASIVQGFSNKHHDGFLGHSWLGEWVNIGAMTTNSDLKNNYGTIRVTLEGVGQLDSGQIKLGCFLADHVKLGIGIHLNGGTVIGTGSNIFGMHAAPKTIPSFTWGGDVLREYRIDGMVKVARTVMKRRKQDLHPEFETMLRDVFAMTRLSRSDLGGLLPGSATPAMPDGEAALVRAEQEAVRAFEPVA
ncbi:MAG: hypothetical protein MUD01_19935 [Chloroflexaceae bacterium]|jgi:UDP-N-acetylglucosamine diphosphorylase/glucosamine-1-phosphate N-acetyltransferase|nr:hypothetical protein [Chloroflexaceae bacterium]